MGSGQQDYQHPLKDFEDAKKIVDAICGGKDIYHATEEEKRDALIKYFIDKQNEEILSLNKSLSEIREALYVLGKHGGYYFPSF